MPCLIIAGHPSAGKTTLANLLKERALLHDAIDEVVIVNEESECGCCGPNDKDESIEALDTEKKKKITKQELYQTSNAEKQTRGALKAAFDRAVKKSGSGGSRKLVILDSMNYIKGFRYELHCISKASGEKHGILWVLNRLSVVQQWNKSYSQELLKELISRFEPPDERNRWDKPLFTVDVAAAADKEARGKLLSSSKNEVLENSVYNMHSLGEAFGTTAAAEPSANAPSSTTTTTTKQTTSESAASTNKPKAPKKSAFSRRKKVTPRSEKTNKQNTAPLVGSFNNHPASKIVFDTSIMTSPPPQNSAVEVGTSNSKPEPIPSPQPQPQPKEEINSTKSLEEQLDDILHTLLLQTQNLKEGMSTRTYD